MSSPATPSTTTSGAQTLNTPATSTRRSSVPQAVGTPSGAPPSKRRRGTEPITKAGIGYNVGFIGSGNMARALVEGMLASGTEAVKLTFNITLSL